MNRPTACCIILSLLFSSFSFSQTGYVFVKKGIRKKHTWQLGDPIALQLKDGGLRTGYINLLKADTIFVSGRPVHKTSVKAILLKRPVKKQFPDIKTVAIIAGGAVITSAGLALSDKQHQTEALIAGPVIGFGPLLIKHFGGRLIRAMHRGKYKIGKKFYLQVLDLDVAR